MKCVLPPTHWAKSANHGTPSIWFDYAECCPFGTYCIFNPKMRKDFLTNDVTFPEKPHGKWNKIEKPTEVPLSYER